MIVLCFAEEMIGLFLGKSSESSLLKLVETIHQDYIV